jgi:hypothetical protein
MALSGIGKEHFIHWLIPIPSLTNAWLG